MFGWFKRKPQRVKAGELFATQPHGEIFAWPKGAVITAVDEVVIGLPTALLDKTRPLGELVFVPDDANVNIPPEGATFFVRLMPGMSISLAKSVQAYVTSEDRKPRRVKFQPPSN